MEAKIKLDSQKKPFIQANNSKKDKSSLECHNKPVQE